MVNTVADDVARSKIFHYSKHTAISGLAFSSPTQYTAPIHRLRIGYKSEVIEANKLIGANVDIR